MFIFQESDISDIDQDSHDEHLGLRLRKDSYLKAIQSDNNHLRAGLQNMLIVFLTNAANVFLLDLSHENIHMLEEQVYMFNYVFYVYIIMIFSGVSKILPDN